MDEATREELRTTVIELRELLEKDFHEQLEGVYGIQPDGKILPVENLTNLSRLQLGQRKIIEAAIKHYLPEHKEMETSVARYVRESAFTALNRLVALKLMEVDNRRLIRPSISSYRESPGFKEFRQVSPALSLAHQDEGYQFYIELIYDDIGNELGVLFDRDLPQGILFPSMACLREVQELINRLPSDIWKEDETIGWVYQFFTPKQLRDRARKESSAPRNSYELAFRNQFYTPRYVVEFLVDNTLGRLWWEMSRGDTSLVEYCKYLIRPPDQPISNRVKCDPRTIKALDPACGSAHFLLYGYELFEIMYIEAFEDPNLSPILKDEYPTLPEFQRAIPGLILEHNLYGIDIDLRATQISALALWLRAQRTYEQLGLKVRDRPEIRRVNIVTAEPMPGDANLINEFLNDLENPVIRELVEKTWTLMGDANEIGSLLKIKSFLRDEISNLKKEWENLSRLVQLQLFAPEKAETEQLEIDFSFIDDSTFWENIESQVLVQLQTFVTRSGNSQMIARKLFAEDAEQGFALIDVLRQEFDLVWMNPPFGKASKGAKEYIDKQYPMTKNDLYAAFVERGLDLLKPTGLLGAITSRTGFFLGSFQKWREEILIQRSQIIAVADLGFGVLDTAMVETAAYILQKFP